MASDEWLASVTLDGGRAVWDDEGKHHDRPLRMLREGEQRCPAKDPRTQQAGCSFPAGHAGRHAPLLAALGDHQVIDIQK